MCKIFVALWIKAVKCIVVVVNIEIFCVFCCVSTLVGMSVHESAHPLSVELLVGSGIASVS